MPAWLDLKKGLPAIRQDKGEKIISHIGIVPKVIRLELFLDHYSNHIQTFQETLETAYAVMRILTRAQPKRLYRYFRPGQKHLPSVRGDICVRTGYHV